MIRNPKRLSIPIGIKKNRLFTVLYEKHLLSALNSTGTDVACKKDIFQRIMLDNSRIYDDYIGFLPQKLWKNPKIMKVHCNVQNKLKGVLCKKSINLPILSR